MDFHAITNLEFPVYLAGCFTAFALSLRSHPDNRVLAFVYGAWIAFCFFVTRVVIPANHPGETAAHLLGFWWYLLQAFVNALPAFCAWQLRDAGARKIVGYSGAVGVLICLAYFVAAGMYFVFGIGDRLPGKLFYDGLSAVEVIQVGSMIILSGPVVPALRWIGRTCRKWRYWPWTHHRLPHRA